MKSEKNLTFPSIITAVLLICSLSSYAQDQAPADSLLNSKDSVYKNEDTFALKIAKPTMSTAEAEAFLLKEDPDPGLEVPKDKLKKPKKQYYGMLTSRRYTKRKSATGKDVIEQFYVLKEFKMPNPFVQEIYWYNTDKRKIEVNGDLKKQREKGNIEVLHGPYKRTVDGKVTDEGVYFVGAKHSRWERYDKNFDLIEKEKYFKGWQKSAVINYFDTQKDFIKEVIPYKDKVLHGKYYLFYDNRQIQETGEYQNGAKIGLWEEYYKFRRMKKRETQYPADSFDRDQKPVLLREWDDKGNIIYDREKGIDKRAYPVQK